MPHKKLKLVQRIRSIERLLGIEFEPHIASSEQDMHTTTTDGKIDKIDKIINPKTK